VNCAKHWPISFLWPDNLREEGIPVHRFAVLLPTFALVLTLTIVADPRTPTRAQEATPAACPETTEAENEATARRWHEEAINRGDLSVIDEIVAPDIVHHAGTFPDGVGPEAVKAVLGSLSAFPDVRHTIEQVIASDEFVVIRFLAEGTQDGEFQGYPPTGEHATWTGINIFRFKCGLIAEEWSEVDGLGRLSQLGLLATPTP
jgi:steroid delta-isomerase-like uncharacterized protein